MDDGPVQDTRRADKCTHIRGELMDLPRTVAVGLAVAREALYVVIVVAEGVVPEGTSVCTVCPGMANLRLSRTRYGHPTERKEYLVRTDGARLSDLVEFERIEIILDVYGRLLKRDFSEEGVRYGR
jgi:hypothetical protein